MGSKTTVSLLLHLIILSITLTDALKCYTTGNFTANSTYAKNRDLVLRSLASNVTANGGFYNTTIGSGNDIVYGLVHCMASPPAGNCSSCVNYAIQALMTACPNQKEAISWGGNPLPCIVRYANRYFFGSLELSPSDALTNTGIIDATFAQFDQAWSGIRDIVTRANSTNSSRNMLAAETIDLSSTKKIYVFMQCTPDVSQSNCGECLQQSVDFYKSCCYSLQGGIVQKPNCVFRWDLYPYYNLFPQVTSPSPPPPSPPFIVSSPPPTSITITKGKENTTSRTVIVTTVPTAILLALVILIITIFRFRKPKQEVIKEERSEEILLRENSNHSYLNEGWPVSGHDNSEQMHYFSLKAIRLATNNFSDANKLGEGGFGPVYKGTLPDGEEIAVKRLCMKSKQGLEEFRNEVMVIAKLQHKNLVRLLGYCLDGDEKLLVYEYLANTSLDAILFDPEKSPGLDWPKRANIISGTARGLQYLHEDSRLKIIHRDMKASNVLLDDQMNPKISDFGTARIFGGDQLEANTNKVVGTFGYMAPEYALEGIISTKSDVYSFGILLLEIITGKKSRGFYSQDQAQSLLFHAWQLWNEGRGQELIDRNVVDSCPIGEPLRWIHIALLCVQDDPARRPTMSLVVFMLGSNAVNLPQPSAGPNSLVKFTSMLSHQSSASVSGSSFLASDLSTTSVSFLEGKSQLHSDERRDP